MKHRNFPVWSQPDRIRFNGAVAGADETGSRVSSLNTDTGDTKMNKRHDHSMTLRLDERLDQRLTDASYDAHMTKAAWIRQALHQSLICLPERYLSEAPGRL